MFRGHVVAGVAVPLQGHPVIGKGGVRHSPTSVHYVNRASHPRGYAAWILGGH